MYMIKSNDIYRTFVLLPSIQLHGVGSITHIHFTYIIHVQNVHVHEKHS